MLPVPLMYTYQNLLLYSYQYEVNRIPYIRTCANTRQHFVLQQYVLQQRRYFLFRG